MIMRISRFKVIMALCLALALSSQDAFAWGGWHHGGERYGHHYYRDGRWYRHGWLGFDIGVAALAIGALVDSLPPRHETILVEGAPYYYYDGVYYRPHGGGYVVVPAPVVSQPVVVAPPPSQLPETLVVNIPNSNGSYTPVTLKRSGGGFIGPQGEYYPGQPTVEQLRVLYGQ